ncbi:hypothetical protein [Microbacterium sp. MPKO10]|uniref:hypothetical protein n=1 Tax=Microbacterium sp. MPKO10 TaxID=2989818 RepID=UPI00223673DA|nr:hypothetical protein [Microbacterium sp. MPKO10]MCW4457851.1 hypothetical protein [Microbacterium sp. MPKO10]
MRQRIVSALAIGSIALALSGCGLGPSGVEQGAAAPTGVSAGMTLYFYDSSGTLTAQQRDTGRLGSVQDAIALLLTGPGSSGLTTALTPTTVTRTEVRLSGDQMSIVVPLTATEATDVGTDQIVCTALASHIQSGGSPDTTVTVHFTVGSDTTRTCPVLP